MYMYTNNVGIFFLNNLQNNNCFSSAKISNGHYQLPCGSASNKKLRNNVRIVCVHISRPWRSTTWLICVICAWKASRLWHLVTWHTYFARSLWFLKHFFRPWTKVARANLTFFGFKKRSWPHQNQNDKYRITYAERSKNNYMVSSVGFLRFPEGRG